ncbi:protein translocase subunit secG [Desulfocurvibacter africanus PCS]|uniref:Protein-export membrane protein SecG n=1 Tax=Desulfocurvibacter africanus PCS TaxID=1262666 RepID=M5Q3P1_DESAF|nr:preprotein translocase subunit SecG [Desulfocurvibacter africanus]EMG38788.1 protein translocase subunit secG [Desulfocurvibacter africanus PCS]
MTALVLTLHILVCIILILMVLLQSGKEGMGVIFGGGSQSFFGSSGAGSLLAKITAVCAAIFLLTSLGYNLLLKERVREGDSLMRGVTTEQPTAAPEQEKPAVTFEEPSNSQTTQGAQQSPEAKPAPEGQQVQ